MLEINRLISRIPELGPITPQIKKATDILITTALAGGQILTCGNGGSAADAEHIAGELMKAFAIKRPLPVKEQEALQVYGGHGEHLSKTLQKGIRTIPLTGMTSLATAYLNDTDPYGIFAQQAYTLAQPGDCLIAISTSGNSKNIIYAAIAAKAKGAHVISLLGGDGGNLKNFSTVSIIAPATETHLIQELHLPIYHTICLEIEAASFLTSPQ